MTLVCSAPVYDLFISILQFMPRISARDSLACDFRDRGKMRRYRRTRRCDPTRRARNEGVAIRVSRSVEEPLCFSIIVNSNKREHARAKVRVEHKAAWRRKRGMALVAVPRFWFLVPAYCWSTRFILRRDTRASPLPPPSPSFPRLVRWVRGHRASGQDTS